MIDNRAKYENQVREVFQDFECKKFEQNNFSSAIVDELNFQKLRKSFIERMESINSLLKRDDNTKWKKTIYDILNGIVDKKNYEGAWAEFCALYEFAKLEFEDLDSEIDVEAQKTLGQYYGKTITNYDLQIGNNLLLDIKIFADKDVRLIQSWCNEATQNTDITMLPEMSYHIEIDEVASNVQNIKKEIKDAINSGETVFQSSIIDVLSYKIQRGSGILMSTSIFDPYLFAKNEHKLIFKHFNKLHKKIPTFLVYVLNPWFSNNNVTSGFQDSQDAVFRAISRRLFMQYKDKMIGGYNKLPRNATQYLSGIIFIIDNSVKNEENQMFFYTNPNAKNKPYKMVMDQMRFTLHAKYDGFEHDNY